MKEDEDEDDEVEEEEDEGSGMITKLLSARLTVLKKWLQTNRPMARQINQPSDWWTDKAS